MEDFRVLCTRDGEKVWLMLISWGGLREMFLIVQQLYRACLSSFCIVLREHSILSAVSGKIWEVIKFVFGNSSLLIITYVIY